MEIEGGDVEVFTDNTRYRFGTRKTTNSTDIGKEWKSPKNHGLKSAGEDGDM